MSDFVTISTYDDYITANFDLHKLEEKDITCYLADENTVAVQWTLNNAVGGIKLRVLENDIELAKQILNEKQEETQIEHQIESSKSDIICPNCQSNNTRTEKYSKSVAGWTWLILGFPLIISLVNTIDVFIVHINGKLEFTSNCSFPHKVTGHKSSYNHIHYSS